MQQEMLDKLRELQGYLAKIYIVEDAMREIPKALQDKVDALNKYKMEYLDLHSKSEKANSDILMLRQALDQAEAERENLEKKSGAAATQREFEAHQKEIEDAKETERIARKNLLSREKTAGELEAKLSEQEENIEFLEAQVNEETAKKDSLLAEKQVELDALSAERDRLKEGIDSDLFYKFSRIIRKKGGEGIVPIHGLVCQGCHMKLPIQFVNDVRKESDDAKFCPYCSRILYYEDVEGAEEQFRKDDFEGLEEGEEISEDVASIAGEDEFDL